MMKLVDQNKNVLVDDLKIAKTFIERTIGLMLKKELPRGSGLLIEKCPSIHTCFMRFNLDVVFLDKDFRVVKIYLKIAPYRITRYVRRAYYALEMESPSRAMNVRVGDQLGVINV